MSRFAFPAFAVAAIVTSASGQSIDSVSIIPALPTDLDPITIRVEGELAHTGIDLVSSPFSRSGSNLWLDLYFYYDGGISLPVVVPYWHEQPVGYLTAGEYDVAVRSFNAFNPFPGMPPIYQLADEAQVSFTVLPEPATMLLVLAASLVALRPTRRPKN